MWQKGITKSTRHSWGTGTTCHWYYWSQLSRPSLYVIFSKYMVCEHSFGILFLKWFGNVFCFIDIPTDSLRNNQFKRKYFPKAVELYNFNKWGHPNQHFQFIWNYKHYFDYLIILVDIIFSLNSSILQTFLFLNW